MKILVIGDPHGTLPRGLSSIVKKNEIELIVVTGEIPPVPVEVFGPKELRNASEERKHSYAEKSYEPLIKELSLQGLPVIILRGNSYTNTGGWNKFSSKIFKKYRNIFYKRTGKFRIKGKNFIVFDMIWEPWAYRWVNKSFMHRDTSKSEARLKKLDRYLKGLEDPILVSHAPPYGYLDVVPSGKNVGSKVILEAIKKYKPRYVLCGHIHEGKGKAKIGKTTVINAGCCGDYFIIDV